MKGYQSLKTESDRIIKERPELNKKYPQLLSLISRLAVAEKRKHSSQLKRRSRKVRAITAHKSF